jgi:hypothetical protein
MHKTVIQFLVFNVRVDWIDLTQDREGWWALMNAVMKLPVP